MGVCRSSIVAPIQKEEQVNRRILVIGGLAAGPSAAAKAKRIDPSADVVLFEKGVYISYGICEIPYLMSNEIVDASKLVIFSPERMEKEKGISVRTLHHVEELLPSKKELKVRDLRDGVVRSEHYDRIIIATGSTPKSLGIEGEKSRNVFVVKALDQAYALKKFLDEESPRRAVVVGGGFIGIEMADVFVRRGMEVTIIHNSSLPMSKLEETTSKAVLEEIRSHGVEFVPNAKVEWFGIGAKGNVVAVGMSGGTIETDLVVIAVGVIPNSSLAEAAGVHIGSFGGISVDDKMKALGPDYVFAAGDCCELRNIVTKKPTYLSLATTASKTGWIAGENAAGGNATFKGTIRAIGVRAFGKEVAHVGMSLRESKEAYFDAVSETVQTLTKPGMMPGAEILQITLIADRKSGRLLGANLVGKEGALLRGNTLAVAIRHGMTLDDISQFDLIYTPPYAPLWDGISVSARQLKKKL